MKIIIIFIIGGLGTLSRYFLSAYVGKKHFLNMPLNIFIVNLIGCFLIGVAFEWLKKYYETSHFIYIILFTAFFGSFTTFSAFILESFLIFKKNGYFLAFSYFSLTFIGSFASFFIGIKMVGWFLK